MKLKDSILLIDDTPSKRELLLKALEDEFADGSVHIQTVTDQNVDEYLPVKDDGLNKGIRSGAPEDRLSFYLQNNPNIKLVIVDHDLSLLESQMSESVVAAACQNAGVPHCRYSRTTGFQTTRQQLLELVEKSQVYSIKIDIRDIESFDFGNQPVCLSTIRNIYEGFEQLRCLIFRMDKEMLNKGPAAILSSILGYPGLEPMFQQYATSYSVMAEILKIREIMDGDTKTEFEPIIRHRLSYILGFWLYNVILKYPGILLNEVAASSYVNLDVDCFLKNKDAFSDAKYQGPFSKMNNHSYWWRYKLDDILIDNDCEDGINYLQSQGIDDLKPSVCHVSKDTPAGFYCLFTKSPISLEHSVGSLSWMPNGADLSRVSKDLYDEVAPFLGF
ncbi:hypothetical protein [Rheinheimera mangrovi]|uniref:hypothetical protein n=1 Tax=Rheinheimera mangrovi TaxID=2498451 RepID=UPI000F8DF0E3|nr:hypothetical protein [Rheinheimera mangrovi]